MDFIEIGKEAEVKATYPEPQLSLYDVLVIVYTSGTSWQLNGFVLTHGNFSRLLDLPLFFWKMGYITHANWCLSHLFAWIAHFWTTGLSHPYSVGGRVSFNPGDIKLPLSNLEMFKPTIFVGNPREYARLQQRIEEKEWIIIYNLKECCLIGPMNVSLEQRRRRSVPGNRLFGTPLLWTKCKIVYWPR